MSRDVSAALDMKKAEAFSKLLLRWYYKNGRDLPWRQTSDPYAILVSEFMLQQTQVATVSPYYKKWLDRFPTFGALARASENDVLRAWQGLGYYARARNLHAAGKQIIHRQAGRFPRAISEMQKLPGVGKYTAHAVATFAFNQPVPIVEANSARVLARLFNLRTPIDSSLGQQTLWNRAASLVPKSEPAIYNSALLDLGALICLPRNPKCGSCPVKKFCRASNPESLPIKRARPAQKQLIERHALIRKNGKVLLQKSSGRWQGMWILPAISGRGKDKHAIYSAAFPFTNHRVTLRVLSESANHPSDPRQRWFSMRELMRIPIPPPHRRAINALLH